MSRITSMRKTRVAFLCGISLLIIMVGLMGLISPVKAYMDENDIWSEPNGYAHAYVRGSFNRIWKPFYAVHHEADIFECLRGRYHFIGWNQNGTVLYDVWGVMQNGVMHVEYDPQVYNQIFTAETEVWAPYSYPPSPNMEYAAAFIGPPGTR